MVTQKLLEINSIEIQDYIFLKKTQTPKQK